MSGFSYPEWIGEVYPPGTKRDGMLASYAGIFPVVEINMSFRRTPAETTIAKWRDAVGESFVFTMKANQRITHWKRLADVAEDVDIFVKACQGLGAKLGPILFQIPPTLRFDAALLETFGGSLVPGFTYALEPRDESFLQPEALDVMRRHGIALCLNTTTSSRRATRGPDRSSTSGSTRTSTSPEISKRVRRSSGTTRQAAPTFSRSSSTRTTRIRLGLLCGSSS